jgi:hypothetical protein
VEWCGVHLPRRRSEFRWRGAAGPRLWTRCDGLVHGQSVSGVMASSATELAGAMVNSSLKIDKWFMTETNK